MFLIKTIVTEALIKQLTHDTRVNVCRNPGNPKCHSIVQKTI